MTPVFDRPEAVKAFVASGIFSPGRSFGEATTIGFANEKEGLVAGFVYHNYEPENDVIEVSGYSTRRSWATKSLVKVIFGYPFEQLRCRMVVARHSVRNSCAIRIWKALGAEQIKLPELRGPGEDELIALLSADTWRNSRFGS